MQNPSRQTIARAVRAHAAEYGVVRAYLFGSYARGEADDRSDVDICIECDDGFTLFSLGGFCRKLESDLGLAVDVVCGEDSFYPHALDRYRRDKVLLYERS